MILSLSQVPSKYTIECKLRYQVLSSLVYKYETPFHHMDPWHSLERGTGLRLLTNCGEVS